MSKPKLTRLERAWILHDVGNSAFSLLLVTILPIFSDGLAQGSGYSSNQATAAWSYLAAASTLLFLVLGPVLGAMADCKGRKKRFFVGFLLLGGLGCALAGWMGSWPAFLVVFFLAKVGYNGSLVFYDSMLPDVSGDGNMDYVSSLGYAFGYIGSCVPFVLCLVLVLLSTAGILPIPAAVASAVAMLITALWWLGLTGPLLRLFRQKYYVEPEKALLRQTFRRLGYTLSHIRQQKPVFLFLIAYFFYIDGVYTIIEIATPYGLSMGIDANQLLLALLLSQLVAFPFSLLYGRLAGRFPVRKLLEATIVFYLLIALFAFQLSHTWEFWALAAMVGMVQGGVQALSRSYFARMIPKEHASEFFGFYDIFGKGASVLGTFLMGLFTQITGKPNLGVLPIALMFAIGLVLLHRVPDPTARPAAEVAEDHA